MTKPSMAMPPQLPEVVPVPHRWVAMTFLLVASFMTILDVTIVNVALPNLQAGLQANDRELAWVVASYILAYAIGLLPFGRLGDAIGRKQIFVAGTISFTVASIICGAAATVEQLIAARVVQGLTAAMITPQVMAIAVTMFQPKERARAFTTFGLVAGLASITGAILGGLLITANFFELGWRLCFFVNIPIGLVTIAGAIRFVPSVPAHPGLRPDIVGIFLAAAAILCIVYPLIEGRGYDWPLWCFALIALSFPLLFAFTLWEQRQARTGRPLLFPIYLMSNRDYMAGGAAIAVLFSILNGFFLILVVFLQQGLLYSPLRAGVVLTSFSLGIAVATFLSGRVVHLKFKIITGSLLLGISLIALGLITKSLQAGEGFASFLFPLLIGGVGSGLMISSLFQSITRTIPIKDMGAASGSLQVLQQIGGAIGVAFSTHLFFTSIATHSNTTASNAQIFTGGLQSAVLFFILACVAIIVLACTMHYRLPQRVPPST